MAVLAALNLVTHLEDLGKLSQSLAWIVDWCRFFVRSFYAWLHFDISPGAQDALTLLALIFAAANFHSIRQHHSSMLPIYFPYFRHSPDLYARLMEHTKGRPAGYFVAAALVYALYLVLFIEIPFLGFSVFALISISVIDLVAAHYRVRGGLTPFPEASMASPITPLGLFANWIVISVPLVIANAHKVILWSAGLVVLLVGLNLLFVTIADPLASLIRELPPPPAASA